MIEAVAKAHLHDHLCWAREALVWKLDGLSEYDVRRPLTLTGTNLLGLVKHNAIWTPVTSARSSSARSRSRSRGGTTRLLVAATTGRPSRESRADVIDLYRRVAGHTRTRRSTEFDLDSLGYVPWWNEEVPLFNVMVHRLSDATRHAGHADILREGLDGAAPGRSRQCTAVRARRVLGEPDATPSSGPRVQTRWS